MRGQHETFLNVKGVDAVLEATKHVYASLFNDRAIFLSCSPRFLIARGIALSAGIQRMVRSDKSNLWCDVYPADLLNLVLIKWYSLPRLGVR
ncbi:PEP/pyruvate-binding domain-containing protein [Photobacterium leiognathi]|uniref:PEP/pyruvate-binding domain-containing protein n=1 Tax=Photobacterium leiognathi TaxID=553611 RepID=UPI0027342B19|nr:PEP/pyruvate-binding domain-containing protein [Photobacterium leiognathi]